MLGLLAEMRDPVARRESGGLKGVGDAVALAVQLLVCQCAALAEDRGGGGPVLCVEARGLDECLELGMVESVHGRGSPVSGQGTLTNARVASPSQRPASASQ